jgi:hypothetical protein
MNDEHTWAIKLHHGFAAVEVVHETEKMVYYADARRGEMRSYKNKFIDWRGDEATARELAAKLTSARAEYDRRSKAARDWYSKRKAEILESVEETPA